MPNDPKIERIRDIAHRQDCSLQVAACIVELESQLAEAQRKTVEAMKEIWLYATYGTGTKCKDARGKQFSAITEIVERVCPSAIDAAMKQEKAR